MHGHLDRDDGLPTLIASENEDTALPPITQRQARDFAYRILLRGLVGSVDATQLQEHLDYDYDLNVNGFQRMFRLGRVLDGINFSATYDTEEQLYDFNLEFNETVPFDDTWSKAAVKRLYQVRQIVEEEDDESPSDIKEEAPEEDDTDPPQGTILIGSSYNFTVPWRRPGVSCAKMTHISIFSNEYGYVGPRLLTSPHIGALDVSALAIQRLVEEGEEVPDVIREEEFGEVTEHDLRFILDSLHRFGLALPIKQTLTARAA